MQPPDGPISAGARLARDSAIVGGATIASRLLGFARDVLIARLLGAGPVADAFLAALRLPNLVRRVLGEGGLNAPFVPLYLRLKAERGEAAAHRFAGEAAGQLGILLIVLLCIGEVFAPWVVLGLAGGFADEPQTLELAALYTRLMLPYLLLTTLASLLAALLNAERRFALAALAPAVMNALLVAFLLVALLAEAAPAATAPRLAAAVSLTGLAHLGLILFGLRRVAAIRPRLRWSPELTRLVGTGGATLLATSAAQLILLVATQIASVEPGAVSALYYADRVFQLPLGFVGVAMGTVVLSEMARQGAAERDAALGHGLALSLALTIPATVALVTLAAPIVSVLFEHGAFTAQDRVRTATALALLALGLPFAAASKVLAQIYFTRHEARAPVLATLLALLAALAVAVLPWWEGGQATVAAGVAASAAFLVQTGALAALLRRDGLWRPRPAAFRPVAAALAASLVMLVVLLAGLSFAEGLLAPGQPAATRLATLSALCLAGLASYAGVGWLFGAFGSRPLR